MKLKGSCKCSLVLLAIYLISCKNSSESPTADIVVNNSLSVLNGYWVKVDYLKKLQITKSAKVSYSDASGISSLSIKSESGDSCKVGIYYNFHEANEGILYLRSKSYQFHDVGNNSIGIIKLLDDNLLSLNIGGNVSNYKRIDKSADADINSYLVKIIFPATDYIVVDSNETTGESSTVKIEKDGSIISSKNLKKVILEIDYTTYDDEDTSSYLKLVDFNGKNQNFNYFVIDKTVYVIDKKYKLEDDTYILDRIDTIYKFIPME